jgi:hypothetical protein
MSLTISFWPACYGYRGSGAIVDKIFGFFPNLWLVTKVESSDASSLDLLK